MCMRRCACVVDQVSGMRKGSEFRCSAINHVAKVGEWFLSC